MANTKVAQALDAVERRPLKCRLRRTSESFVRAGRLVDQAICKSARTRDRAAEEYGTSASLLARQIENTDNQHLSFQRLWSMPDDFRIELVVLQLKDLGIAVTLHAEIPIVRIA